MKTFAERKSKPAPGKGSPSWQPSPGWQPPYCMRSSSGTPSSNSWLPTPLYEKPMAVKASIVGSSWKRPESSGVPPIMSPDERSTVLAGFCDLSVLTCVERYSAPPAST